jgi:hypothetical protein
MVSVMTNSDYDDDDDGVANDDVPIDEIFFCGYS